MEPVDRYFIKLRREKRAPELERERMQHLIRAKQRPVLPENRWDYNPPYKLPGEK